MSQEEGSVSPNPDEKPVEGEVESDAWDTPAEGETIPGVFISDKPTEVPVEPTHPDKSNSEDTSFMGPLKTPAETPKDAPTEPSQVNNEEVPTEAYKPAQAAPQEVPQQNNGSPNMNTPNYDPSSPPLYPNHPPQQGQPTNEYPQFPQTSYTTTPPQQQPYVQPSAPTGSPYGTNTPPQPKPKDFTIAYALLFFFGTLGVHKFYLGQAMQGLIYLGITILSMVLSFIGIGVLGILFLYLLLYVDIRTMPEQTARSQNGEDFGGDIFKFFGKAFGQKA